MAWRTHPQSTQGYLFILEPKHVFRAQMDINVGEDTYPAANIKHKATTLGTPEDTRPGMTVLFGSSAGMYDLGRNRLRDEVGNSRVKIGYSSQGNADGEVILTDEGYITVLDDHRVWAKIPRIEGDGTQYKDFKTRIEDNGAFMPPVANAGCGFCGFVDAGGTIEVTFDGSGSYTIADAATIIEYDWVSPDGIVTAGAENTDTVTYEFGAGFRWVRLKVTDSNGKKGFHYIPVFVAEASGTYAPVYAFNVRRTLSPEGQVAEFEVFENLPASRYPPGTLVMYWEEEEYDGVIESLYGLSGREHMKFIGWIDEETLTVRTDENGVDYISSFTALDVAGRLAKLPGFPQIIQIAETPESWDEMVNPDIVKYIHYLLQWHSTALELAELRFDVVGTDYPFKILGSEGATLYEQVNQSAQAIVYRLTCDSQNVLRIVADPILLEEADRTTDVLQDLTEDDLMSLNLTHNRNPDYHWLTAAAIKARNDKIKAIQVQAPGKAPGQGAQELTINNRLVQNGASFAAQEGNRYARLNSEFGDITMTLVHGNDGGIEPALMKWITLTTENAYAIGAREYTFNEDRLLPRQVQIDYNTETGAKTVTITAEKETVGNPAIIIREPADDEGPGGGDNPPDYPPKVDDVRNTVVVVDTGGNFFRTREFTIPSSQGGPFWKKSTGGTSGTPLRFLVDPFSPYLVDGTGDVNGWLLTSTDVYYVTGITGIPSPDSVLTFGDNNVKRSFDVSTRVANRVAVLTHEVGEGMICHHTTNGVTWDEDEIVPRWDTDTDFNYCPGIQYSRNSARLYANVPAAIETGDPQQSVGYYSDDNGATWDSIVVSVNSPFKPFIYGDDELCSDFVIPKIDNSSDTESYFGRVDIIPDEAGADGLEITFDSGGFEDYTVEEFPDPLPAETTHGIDGAGNPGNAYRLRSYYPGGGGTLPGGSIYIHIDFASSVFISSASCTVKGKIETGTLGISTGAIIASAEWSFTDASGTKAVLIKKNVNDDTWITLSPTSNPDTPVSQVRIRLTIAHQTNTFSERDIRAWIDNIEIDYVDSGEPASKTGKRYLFRAGTRLPIPAQNISPFTFDTEFTYFGPDNLRSSGGGIGVSNGDLETLMLVGTNYERDLWGVWISQDAGNNWVEVVEPDDDATVLYRRVFPLQLGTGQFVIFGASGTIALTTDFGNTFDSRKGNLGALGIGEIIGIWTLY